MKGAREWVRQRKRKRDEREKESGWERPTVAMETGSYQLTPCFPLVPHPPPTPFPFPRSPFIFPSLHPQLLQSFFSFPHPAYRDHTLFTFLSHTPTTSLRHLSLSTSTTPLFLPTSPSHPFLASFPPTRSHIFFRSHLFFLPYHLLSSSFCSCSD